MITRAALDYLPVAVRAAERNPDNSALWSEAVRAQRAIIAAADAHLPERAAANVQACVGQIANLATVTGSGISPYNIDLYNRNETLKRLILALFA